MGADSSGWWVVTGGVGSWWSVVAAGAVVVGWQRSVVTVAATTVVEVSGRGGLWLAVVDDREWRRHGDGQHWRLEKDAFTRKDLDDIAEKLVLEDPYKGNWTPLRVIFKPHHNSLTGNYDINVLIAAVEGKGKKVIWHDRRNKASSINLDESESKLTGIVLNIPVKRYGGIWKSRHWVCLRKINGVWYNLDSDFASPYSFESVEELRDFLDAAISAGTEILIVKKDE